jgi:hypothetical protein
MLLVWCGAALAEGGSLEYCLLGSLVGCAEPQLCIRPENRG